MKNKQPVYLKPKTPNNSNNKTESIDKTSTTNQNVSSLEDVPFETTQTQANENNDVVRSELKALRQSAVAMSVSQKDGANQIVQDWLETEGGDIDEGESADNTTDTESK